jgi:hypothetical protein
MAVESRRPAALSVRAQRIGTRPIYARADALAARQGIVVSRWA